MTKLILALDVSTRSEALALANRVSDDVQWVKVGSELFTGAGPAVVEDLVKLGMHVMLDLKFKDIPETVARSVTVGCKLGARMLTVHADGGGRMLEAAQKAAGDWGATILAVTVLTSLDSEDMGRLGIPESRADHVQRLANIASLSNVKGLVCSVHEAAKLRDAFPDTTLVTPGIRPAGSAVHDQKMIDSPAAAKHAGANYIVVGRPIRDAQDPATAAREIVLELS
jgi:orotidine-5'-phosphate decarboxylase